MGAAVEAVARLRGQVDAADEGDAVVDRRSSSRGGSASAAPAHRARSGSAFRGSGSSRIVRTSPREGGRAAAALRPKRARARRPDRRARPAGPAGSTGSRAARERELGREEPAGDVDVRLRALELRHDPRQRLRRRRSEPRAEFPARGWGTVRRPSRRRERRALPASRPARVGAGDGRIQARVTAAPRTRSAPSATPVARDAGFRMASRCPCSAPGGRAARSQHGRRLASGTGRQNGLPPKRGGSSWQGSECWSARARARSC